jgi:hypothetical protein
VRVVRYVTPLREGGSLPAIVEADDDALYGHDGAAHAGQPEMPVADLSVQSRVRHFLSA